MHPLHLHPNVVRIHLIYRYPHLNDVVYAGKSPDASQHILFKPAFHYELTIVEQSSRL